MEKNTGNVLATPVLTLVSGGLALPRPRLTVVTRATEAQALDAAREEWHQIDPATGRVLSTVTAEDEADLATMLQDEEWARRPDAAAYGLSRAARLSLGMFALAEIEEWA